MRASKCTVIGITNHSTRPPLALPSRVSQLLIVDALISAILKADAARRGVIDVTAESVSDRNY